MVSGHEYYCKPSRYRQGDFAKRPWGRERALV